MTFKDFLIIKAIPFEMDENDENICYTSDEDLLPYKDELLELFNLVIPEEDDCIEFELE